MARSVKRPPKAAMPADEWVGSRVRMRRNTVRMSQTELGVAIGLTFQQIQKYEKGINRIGAGRLQQISRVLGMPVAWFFEGAPQPTENGRGADQEDERPSTLYAVALCAGDRRQLRSAIRPTAKEPHAPYFAGRRRTGLNKSRTPQPRAEATCSSVSRVGLPCCVSICEIAACRSPPAASASCS